VLLKAPLLVVAVPLLHLSAQLPALFRVPPSAAPYSTSNSSTHVPSENPAHIHKSIHLIKQSLNDAHAMNALG
jgi:hypothetical protein